MRQRLLSLLLGLLTLVIVLYGVFAETEGLRALTSAALPSVRARTHPVFSVNLRSAVGVDLSSLPGKDTVRIVEITYERCRTICTVQGAALSELFRAFSSEIGAKRLLFISLSVDPDDCPAGISTRVHRLSGGGHGWDGVCLRDPGGLDVLNRQIGVVAIRDRLGEFKHTEGVFLVGSNGRVLAYQPTLDKQTLALSIQQALQDDREAQQHG